MENPGAASIVLTGGSSRLPGLDEMARRIIGPNVRVGGANPAFALPDTLRGPEFATGVGLVSWALDHPGEPRRAPPGGGRRPNRPAREGQAADAGARRAKKSGGFLRRLFPN